MGVVLIFLANPQQESVVSQNVESFDISQAGPNELHLQTLHQLWQNNKCFNDSTGGLTLR